MAARIGWYGDDFTGATDTLATLAERGLKALLFLRVPSAAQLAAAGPLDAIGIAGAARSMAPVAMRAELEPAGAFFAAEGVRILHYKICSTFDSAPHVGNIAVAAGTLRPFFPNPLLAIVGGQPNLGRYCLFGHLFAAVSAGGQVARIDRHPTMKAHPVTPMAESDLATHLEAQGFAGIAAIDYRAYEAGDFDARLDALAGAAPVLLDVSREADLAPIGRALWRHAARGPMLAIGASSVARALTAEQAAAPAPAQLAPAVGPVLAMVGSLSPVTRRQVEAATGFARTELDASRLVADAAYAEDVALGAARRLAEGRHAMLVTRAPDGAGGPPASAVAAATAALTRRILDRHPVKRLVIAGGDTSSLAAKSLALWGLVHKVTLGSGSTISIGRSDDPRLDGIEIMLKGGQMGPPDIFARVLAGIGG